MKEYGKSHDHNTVIILSFNRLSIEHDSCYNLSKVDAQDHTFSKGDA